MGNACQYAQDCDPHHGLPFTGGTVELVALVVFALVAITIGLLVRYSAAK